MINIPARLAFKITALCAGFLLSSCTVINEQTKPYDSDLVALEAAMTSVDGALDTLSPNAFFRDCPLTFSQPCTHSSQVLDFEGCEPVAGVHYFGQVRVAYEGDNCALDIGEKVLRTHSLRLQSMRGGALQTSGGIALARTGVSVWELTIGNVKKSLKRSGVDVTSLSVKTAEPVKIAGTLERPLRVVSDGVTTVLDLKNDVISAYRFHGLRYEARCCHPVSGKVEIAKAGAKHAEVQFHGCGQGTMFRGEKQTPITLTYCE